MVILRFYTIDYRDEPLRTKTMTLLHRVSSHTRRVQIERCYHVEMTKAFAERHSKEEQLIRWLLKPSQGCDTLATRTLLPLRNDERSSVLIEIGPRFNFSTAFSTNCVNICRNVGIEEVTRIETSYRYLIDFEDKPIDESVLIDLLSDRMTECRYTESNRPVESFNECLPAVSEVWSHVPIIEQKRPALEEANKRLGLAFDDWDFDYYTDLFVNVLKRNPTTVELFDCAQSNSEHSRHWFFRGRMIIDDVAQPCSLIRMVMDTQLASNDNNTIKFNDNSSAIRGFKSISLSQSSVDGPGAIQLRYVDLDLIFTAETHNMPTAVAPFSGATTGTGGRIRDVQSVGRGGRPIAGTAGYCVGCLNIPGYPQPCESETLQYPLSFAKPLKVLIEASNGASDYGNKFGEPVIAGFVCSYGLTNVNGERDEFVKPIMFSGGLGTMNASMRKKAAPEKGMLLAKIGGPVYRIGVGGGAASSVMVQGSGDADLDFNAVQRGDAEMENKLNRVIRACIELGSNNPILAIHDQGAGGNGNVLKELVEPDFAGAIIFTKAFQLGDPTITALELWGAEYQENNAILCRPEDRALLESICARERCPICFVGIVTGNGRVTLVESEFNAADTVHAEASSSLPFDLQLRHVLGDMPKREYKLERMPSHLIPLRFDSSLVIAEMLDNVLRLVVVGSKRFLTNKVDRCVTGLIAQQQCVGPLQIPLADYGLSAISYFGFEGIATSIGTQPIKGLLDPKSMARMCVAEALSNMVFVKISEMADIKCSANWMWAAKLPGEGAKLYDACKAMCEFMTQLHIAIDGGKDSLSMAAKTSAKGIVKSPGTLVISAYAPCPDIRVKVTPDLKGPAMKLKTTLLWINIEGRFRLGASALAQSTSQQGEHCPTVDNAQVLANAFNVTQCLLQDGQIYAGHDISDGGLIVTLLEMSFGGCAGLNVDLTNIVKSLAPEAIDPAAIDIGQHELAVLFAEECGWVLEVATNNVSDIRQRFNEAAVPNYVVGNAVGYGLHSSINITSNGRTLISDKVRNLLKQWERTSFEIEKLQMNKCCAIEEFKSLDIRTPPRYHLTMDLNFERTMRRANEPVIVAVLREEGVNSDREMMASLMKAHFEVHDVTMTDLLAGRTTLDRYRGLIFPGGFSYADTLGSAKGWAANILFHDGVREQFEAFKRRNDNFSLGVCNGCQLMALIGWVGDDEVAPFGDTITTTTPTTTTTMNEPNIILERNESGRFECRWVSVKVESSPALMLRSLQGSVLGCWVAHGEGRFSFLSPDNLLRLMEESCIALVYVDDDGVPTESYPMNPNGSPGGLAAICSKDGRHLAIMPHPERSSAMFQWPYVPVNFQPASEHSPWQLMFNDAYEWCVKDDDHKETAE